jgi:outer membrane protein assembly factor BamA
MRKSKLEERELAFQDAIRNKDAEIYSLCQREMELIQVLNKLKEDKDAEIQSLNWKIHHYQRREAEMYEIIQSKQKETKDAFLRRETELLEALEQRDEVMRFTRGRLEALVKCSRSAGRTLLSQY